MSARSRGRRGERFWSNSSFICGQGRQSPLAVGGERQASAATFGSEIGKLRENLLLGHPARQVLQHVRYGHAHAADAGLAAALARLDCDDLSVVHNEMIAERARRSTVIC